jgi:hypothetical protein
MHRIEEYPLYEVADNRVEFALPQLDQHAYESWRMMPRGVTKLGAGIRTREIGTISIASYLGRLPQQVNESFSAQVMGR